MAPQQEAGADRPAGGPPAGDQSAGDQSVDLERIEIRDEAITIGQLLKLHGVAGTGADAKDMLAAEAVMINGEIETRRGAKVRPGDIVDAAGEVFTVVARQG